MCRKQLIFFSLLIAYLLMLAHSVIPHHHHENQQEAVTHHHTEQTVHHHNQAPAEGHGHTPHFVHSSDFGNYILPPTFKLTDSSGFNSDLLFFVPTAFNFYIQSFVAEVEYIPDHPPPYQNNTPLPNGLRGSPSSLFAA